MQCLNEECDGHYRPICDTCEFTGWISVKDKLPEKYERVLVTNGKEICLHYKQSSINWEGWEGHDLYCSCPINHNKCDFIEGDITHWMPLPKIPYHYYPLPTTTTGEIYNVR